jgi:hypothetical protein
MAMVLRTMGCLVLSALAVHPANPVTAAECDFPVEIPLGPEKVVIYKTWDLVPHRFTESLVVDWEGGVLSVNGFVHRPHPERYDPLMELQTLKTLYGSVPFFRDFVATAEGTEAEIWNKAYYAWDRELRRLELAASRRYADALQAPECAGPHEAAADAASWLEESPLVAEAIPRPDISSQRDKQVLEIAYDGRPDSMSLLTLYLDSQAVEYRESEPIDRDHACALVLDLQRRLLGSGPARVEFVCGSLRLYSEATSRHLQEHDK